MTLLSWFKERLIKLDQSLDEFYADTLVIHNLDGTVQYVPINTTKNNISDKYEDEPDVLK